jgi:hypothetical protein
MTNERGQLLVPVRKIGDSKPYIEPPNGERRDFTPGCAVYCAPRSLTYISDDIEFFFVH